jgi:DNA replication protein DnaC
VSPASNADECSSFLSSLNEATTTGGPESAPKQPQVGDALQQKAIALANQGCNLFLTGRAGTGKSWATKRIIEDFTKNKKIIFATAPTGIAAINVDGMTLHNWGRFNLGQYCEFVLCY